MINRSSKNDVRQKVHERIRNRIVGNNERPRLNVYRSLNHIYAQLIDDRSGATLVSANSLESPNGTASKGKKSSGGNVAAAKVVGKKIAERAKELLDGEDDNSKEQEAIGDALYALHALKTSMAIHGRFAASL